MCKRVGVGVAVTAFDSDKKGKPEANLPDDFALDANLRARYALDDDNHLVTPA